MNDVIMCLKGELKSAIINNTIALEKADTKTIGPELELYRQYLIGRRVALLETYNIIDSYTHMYQQQLDIVEEYMEEYND